MTINTDNLDWDKSPLIPAIVQDSRSRQVLMLGFMNAAALDKTQQTGKVTFFSRSRQTLWTKGETSGNWLHSEAIYPDCDNDTLLILARPVGPTCHRGTVACFDEAARQEVSFLTDLERTIRQRIDNGGDESYVARLHAEGRQRIAQKIGEEGVELALAAVGDDDDAVLEETADLLFHTLILLNSRGQRFEDVVSTLRRRAGADRQANSAS